MLIDLHLALIIATVLGVLYSDEQALLWVLGKKRVLSRTLIERLHAGVSTGLGLVILSGGLLYIRAPQAYLSNTTFIVKMAAILALILNTYAISRLSGVASTRPYASLMTRDRIPLFLTGAVSLVGWCTALFCGYLLG